MKLFLKISASIALLFLILSFTDIKSVLNNLMKLKATTVCLGVTILLLAQIISTYRWQRIIKIEGADLPFRTLFSSYMVGMFVNNFLPSSIGGDVVKIYDVYRTTHNTTLATISVFMERFSGLIVLLLIPWFGIKYFFDLGLFLIFWGWIGAQVVLIITGIMLFSTGFSEFFIRLLERFRIKKIASLAKLFFEGLAGYKKKKIFGLLLLILSIPVQFSTIFLYKMVANDIGVYLSLSYCMFAIPIIALISLAPISLGGIGVREGITIFLFTQVGIAPESALSISLLETCIIYLGSLSGGLFFFLRKGKIKNIKITQS